MEGNIIQLNDEFLEDVGLAGLTAVDRKALLQHVYEELELRVGEKLSDGMTDSELEEFETIIDRDYEAIVGWLEVFTPDFLHDPLYRRMNKSMPQQDRAEVVCEYAATKWLEIKRPDYRDIVDVTLNELKSELRRDADRLLGRG